VAACDSCGADFAFERSLIDLLAPGTADGEWETFGSALRAGPFGLRAFRDGQPIPLPDSAAGVFAEREVGSGTVMANCHFFGGDLKLDIDPREVPGPAAFETVLAVMRFVAAAIGRPVFAVAEGGTPLRAFLRVSPDSRPEFLRAKDVRHAEPSRTSSTDAS
jgi:hypothetical protein